MRELKDVEYCPGYAADVYLPEENGFDTIVYFHGGGMTEGSKNGENIVDIARFFAGNGYCVVCADYALYPAAKFPEYLVQCAAAVAFARKETLKNGGSGKIIVMGQSAGAWISLMLCFDGKYLEAAGADKKDIEAWLIDSAQPTSHYNVIAFEEGLSPKTQRIDKYAPLYYLDENAEFSKMLLVYYEHDMPCRAAQNRLLYEAVKNFRPQADIKEVCLKGGHCSGSSVKEPDGTYRFACTALKFLKGERL